MLRYLKVGLQIAAMLAVMAIALGVTLRLSLHAGEVTVPELSGLTLSEASGAALRNGLDLNIERSVYSTTVPAGRILSQSPAPGSAVRKGWQVRVSESLGPQQVTIPNVVGEPLRQATMDLRRNQLDLGSQVHIDAPGTPDMVLAQTPPPDAGVDQPRVNLLLSGSEQDPGAAFVMPSFIGLGYTAASHEAIALGLRVATIGGVPVPAPLAPVTVTTPDAAGQATASGSQDASPVPSPVPSTPGGPVLLQSPEAGHRGVRGETIRLYFTRPSSTANAASAPVLPAPATPQ